MMNIEIIILTFLASVLGSYLAVYLYNQNFNVKDELILLGHRVKRSNDILLDLINKDIYKK